MACFDHVIDEVAEKLNRLSINFLETELGSDSVLMHCQDGGSTAFSQDDIVCSNYSNVSDVEIHRMRVPNVPCVY